MDRLLDDLDKIILDIHEEKIKLDGINLAKVEQENKLRQEYDENIRRNKNMLDIEKNKKIHNIKQIEKSKLQDIDKLNLNSIEDDVYKIKAELNLSEVTESSDFEDIVRCRDYIKDNFESLQRYYNKYKFKEENKVKEYTLKLFSKLRDYDFKVLLVTILILINLVYMFFNRVFRVNLKSFSILVIIGVVAYFIWKNVSKVYKKDDLSLIDESYTKVQKGLNNYKDLLNKEKEIIREVIKEKIEKIEFAYKKAEDTLKLQEDANLEIYLKDLEDEYLEIFQQESLKRENDAIVSFNKQVKERGITTLGETEDGLRIIYRMNNLIINYNEDVKIKEDYLQRLLIDIIKEFGSNQVQFRLVDMLNFGESFKYIIPIKEKENNEYKKIGVNKSDLSDVLDSSIKHIGYIIQNKLKDDYKNIYEYNLKEQDKVAYEFLVIQDFQTITDESILKKLNLVMSKGVSCGLIVILSGVNLDISNIQVPYDYMVYENNRFNLKVYNYKETDMELKEIIIEDIKEDVDKICKDIDENSSLSFIDIVPDALWQDNPSEEMIIPIGFKDNGGIVNLRLGGKGINHHVLLGGNTGSGKTSFIHTVINSACMRYSPKDLELILLDFKQGVEFQIYKDYELPHAKFLGLESDREFALNTLKYVYNELERRAELCKNLGVPDIQRYNQKSDIKMKRTLIIIDEFQELFRGMDVIEEETRVLFDQITRLGRSFGVHLILSSQSISGIQGGLGGIENRLGTRVALRCNEDDSRVILSNDNAEASELTRIGQGIFNEQQGKKYGNVRFTFAYLDDTLREKNLELLKQKGKEIGYEPETKVFYKSKIRRYSESEWLHRDRGGKFNLNVLLGDSSLLTKSFVDLSFNRQSGENLTIITKDIFNKNNILTTIIKSLDKSIKDNWGVGDILIFDADLIGDELGIYEEFIKGLHCNYKLQGIRNFKLDEIYNEVILRNKDGNYTLGEPIILILNNIQKVREFQEDEYSSDATRMLNEILREGPYVGVHVISVVDSLRSLDRLRVKILDESIHRVVGKMNDLDSLEIINDRRAVLLDSRLEALYYNDITMGCEKIRVLLGGE